MASHGNVFTSFLRVCGSHRPRPHNQHSGANTRVGGKITQAAPQCCVCLFWDDGGISEVLNLIGKSDTPYFKTFAEQVPSGNTHYKNPSDWNGLTKRIPGRAARRAIKPHADAATRPRVHDIPLEDNPSRGP